MHIIESEIENYYPEQAQREIQELVKTLADYEQVEMPVTHHFSPGVYIRELFIPAGVFLIGHEHKDKCLNIVLSGSIRVMIEGKIATIKAPYTFESGPGVTKVGYAEEDTRWLTIHPNPDNETNIARIEEKILNLSPEFLSEKGDLDIDTFRMQKTRKELEECHLQALP